MTATRQPVMSRSMRPRSGWTPGGSPSAATVLGATWRRPSRSWHATGADRRLAFQLLVYPVTNHAFDTPSYRAFGRGYGLTEAAMRWFWGQYLARPDDGTQSAGLAAAGRPARVAAGIRDDGRVRPATRRGRGLCRPPARRRCDVRSCGGTTGSFTASSRWAESWTAASRPSTTRRRPCAQPSGLSRRPVSERRPRERCAAPTARHTPGTLASIRATRPAAASCSSTPRAQAAPDAIGHAAKGATSGRISPTSAASIERALLIESVLDPSRQIVEGYRPTVVATTDGRVFSGIVKGAVGR